MAQNDQTYFGTYCRLDKSCGGLSSSIKGDAYAVGSELAFSADTYISERGKDYPRGTVSSLHGEVAGYIPTSHVTRLCKLAEEGWTIRAICSAVGYSKDESYWLEVAVIAYEPKHASAFEPFFEGLCDRIGRGERPDVRLSAKLIDDVLANPKTYNQLKGTTYAKLPKGEAYYKRERTTTETMAAAGSKNNIGCWVGTVLFYAVIIAAVVGVIWYFFIR